MVTTKEKIDLFRKRRKKSSFRYRRVRIRDFSTLISNPKLMLLGAAAQMGIFITFIGVELLALQLQQACYSLFFYNYY